MIYETRCIYEMQGLEGRKALKIVHFKSEIQIKKWGQSKLSPSYIKIKEDYDFGVTGVALYTQNNIKISLYVGVPTFFPSKCIKKSSLPSINVPSFLCFGC